MKMNGAANEPAISTLVGTGRRKFQQLLGHTGQTFASVNWDVSDLRDNTVSAIPRYFHFTCYQSEEALPAVYADVIKSWLLLNYSNMGTAWSVLQAAKCFWAILERKSGRSFRWQGLSEADVNELEVWLASRYSDSTVYARLTAILNLANFLAARSICRPLFYVMQTPAPNRHGDRLTPVGETAHQEKLPSKRVLEGLANLYSGLATEAADRMLLCAVGILAVTGFRLGELLTLPVDCEVKETHKGQAVYGIRYYREKTSGGTKMLAVRWLTALQAELARQAIGEIRQLTQRARERARLLETHPDRIPILGYKPEERVDTATLSGILGFKDWRYVRTLARNGLPDHPEPGKLRKRYYVIGEVETYLLKYRCEPLWVVDRGDGRQQLLSQTLLIVPRNFFKSNTNPMWLLVEPVKSGHIQTFLAGGHGTQSVFERYDIREEDGSLCRLSSHRFRHWLSDVADKGGMPVDSIARWLGHENRLATEAYRHATFEERVQWVKQSIRNGQIHGALAEAYFEIPLVGRDVFLEGQIQAVHFTPMGICVHDFAIEPCPYHLNCVRGCPDYLRTRGDAKERRHLLRLKAETEKALAAARQHADEYRTGIAPAWVKHNEETLKGIEAALAVDEKTECPDGMLVKPAN